MVQKYKITFWYLMFSLLIAIILFISIVGVQAYNDLQFDSQHEIFSNFTEYKIWGISAKDLVNKLTRMIENDSSACYGNRSHFIKENTYTYLKKSELVYKIDTFNMTVFNDKAKIYSITFLMPYDNSKIHLKGNFFWSGSIKERELYKMFENKIEYSVRIFETSPVILLLNKGEDFDEQKILNNLHKYFEDKYLKQICVYERNDFWNGYFFCVKWSFYNINYLIIAFFSFFIVVFSVDNYLNYKKRHREDIEDVE